MSHSHISFNNLQYQLDTILCRHLAIRARDSSVSQAVKYIEEQQWRLDVLSNTRPQLHNVYYCPEVTTSRL